MSNWKKQKLARITGPRPRLLGPNFMVLKIMDAIQMGYTWAKTANPVSSFTRAIQSRGI